MAKWTASDDQGLTSADVEYFRRPVADDLWGVIYSVLDGMGPFCPVCDEDYGGWEISLSTLDSVFRDEDVGVAVGILFGPCAEHEGEQIRLEDVDGHGWIWGGGRWTVDDHPSASLR